MKVATWRCGNFSHDPRRHRRLLSGDQTFEQLIIDTVEGRSIVPFEEIFVGTKEITKVSLLEKTPVVETKSKNETTGKSLAEDSTPEAIVCTGSETLAKARDAKTKTLSPETNGLPKDVYEAFMMLLDGKAKTVVAAAFNTSTRSIGRWMEKHGFDSFQPVTPVTEDVSQEDLEATAEMAPQIIKILVQPDPANTLPQQAKCLFMGSDYVELYAFKKAKKKSWAALGFDGREQDLIEANKPS